MGRARRVKIFSTYVTMPAEASAWASPSTICHEGVCVFSATFSRDVGGTPISSPIRMQQLQISERLVPTLVYIFVKPLGGSPHKRAALIATSARFLCYVWSSGVRARLNCLDRCLTLFLFSFPAFSGKLRCVQNAIQEAAQRFSGRESNGSRRCAFLARLCEVIARANWISSRVYFCAARKDILLFSSF